MPESKTGPVPRSPRANLPRLQWGTLLIAIVLGILIWSYVDSRRTEERMFDVEVNLEVPEGWEIEGAGPPDAVPIRLRGPRAIMSAIRASDMIFTPLLTAPDGESGPRYVPVTLSIADLQGVPPEAVVTDIVSPTFELMMVRPVRKYIPVEAVFDGELPAGYRLGAVKLTPAYIAAFAPGEQFDDKGGDKALTQPVDLTGRTRRFTAYVDLRDLKLKTRTVSLDESVQVQVEVVKSKRRQTFSDVYISLLLSSPLPEIAGSQIDPPTVKLTVDATDDVLKRLSAASVAVYIDTRELGASFQDAYELPCRVIVPEDVSVVQVDPPVVRWVLNPASAKTGTPAVAPHDLPDDAPTPSAPVAPEEGTE